MSEPIRSSSFNSAAHAPVPLWRDTRVIQIVAQIVFLIAVVIFFYVLINNLVHNLEASRMPINYRVLERTFGTHISEGDFELQAGETTNLEALYAGFRNTLRVVWVGLVGATLLGIIIGIGRLSTNFLVRTISVWYIEIFRNTPLLVQLYFIYRGMRLVLPELVQDSFKLGPFYFNRRGMNYPAVHGTDTAWILYLCAGLGLIIGVILWKWRLRVQEKTGQPANTLLWFTPALVIGIALGWLITGKPFTVDVPKLSENKRNFVSGARFTAEYVALTLGLILYTAAFIADIVRAGIQAVSYGQIEAARAQGFTGAQTLRLIVLPQAMRLVIPPLGNQYLNLAKNSSLGIAIGFFDVYMAASVVQNQTSQPVAVFSVMMLIYLSMSLVISMVMNAVNYRMRLRSR